MGKDERMLGLFNGLVDGKEQDSLRTGIEEGYLPCMKGYVAEGSVLKICLILSQPG